MLKVEELTVASFEPYGRFLNPEDCGDPAGSKDDPVQFYPDRVLQQFGASNYVAFNPLIIKPRPFVITLAEIHERTEEVFGGFTEDVCFHVGPAGDKEPPMDGFQVFRLPAGWWARIKRGVWHHGPFVMGDKPTTGMVVLPPHTYTNDCYVVELERDIKIEL
jgi:ureidoglycolate hydrolase